MSDRSRGSSGSERLLESLWQDARREAGQNMAGARARADKLIADTRDYRELEGARAHERAREKAAPETARILNRARSAVEKEFLDGRYSFLDGCLARARKLLNEDKKVSRAARSAFDPLFSQATAYFDTRDHLRITVAPDDLVVARDLASEAGFKCTVVQDKNTLGGARIETTDGSRVVDNTIAGRLAVMGERPPVEILGLTFPGTRSIPDPDGDGTTKRSRPGKNRSTRPGGRPDQ